VLRTRSPHLNIIANNDGVRHSREPKTRRDGDAPIRQGQRNGFINVTTTTEVHSTISITSGRSFPCKNRSHMKAPNRKTVFSPYFDIKGSLPGWQHCSLEFGQNEPPNLRRMIAFNQKLDPGLVFVGGAHGNPIASRDSISSARPRRSKTVRLQNDRRLAAVQCPDRCFLVFLQGRFNQFTSHRHIAECLEHIQALTRGA
jgi:hypothetical protein